jgi:hypothetical protein
VALAVTTPDRLVASHDTAAAANAPAIGLDLPDDLRKKLEALMAQLDAAAMEQSPEVRAATLADLKEMMAKLDPAMQKKLEEMLKNKLSGPNPGDGKIGNDQRGDRADNANGGLPEDVKWALDNAAQRMAQAQNERQTNEQNPAASTKTGEMGAPSAQAKTEMAGAPAPALVRESASDPGAKMMMSAGGPMGGDSQPGAGGQNQDAKGAAEALLVAQALRKELVEANADALGENVDKEDLRRKTEQGKSALGFTRVTPSGSYEPSRSTAPPPVPEARRPLLWNYFIRKQ